MRPLLAGRRVTQGLPRKCPAHSAQALKQQRWDGCRKSIVESGSSGFVTVIAFIL
jgi:hypothetical protein